MTHPGCGPSRARADGRCTILDWLVSFLGPLADPWGYPIVFAIAAAEASLFVGLVVPGETILLVAGYLAWRGHGSLVGFVAAAFIGAVVGDSIGFEIGRRLGEPFRQSAFGRRIGERRWDRAGRFLEKHGGSSVFLARFITGPRAIVPFLAGESGMRYVSFLVWNIAGAAVWAVLHVGIGYAAGPSIDTVDTWVGRLGWMVLGVVVLAVVVIVLRRRRARTKTAP